MLRPARGSLEPVPMQTSFSFESWHCRVSLQNLIYKSAMALTYLQSLQKGLKSLFEHDSRVILIGEDVLDPYGGAFKVTAGLSTLYPNRVFTTPISEASITGLGAGLALRGYLPIVEIMFGDFLTLCADQIVNHAAKFPLMYKNVSCPLIIRTPMGGGGEATDQRTASQSKKCFLVYLDSK